MKSNIENIITKILSGEELESIIGLPNEYPKALIEEISLNTALKYWNGDIDFWDGDRIMNIVYGYWLYTEYYFKNYRFSHIAWECFTAFDSGEYLREEDEDGIDPAEKYTKPQIQLFLKKNGLFKT